jgi:hypothetical protein
VVFNNAMEAAVLETERAFIESSVRFAQAYVC